MQKSSYSHWINISDIMSALMMIFMFIAIAFMFQLQKEEEIKSSLEDELRKQRETYKVELNKALRTEFSEDLKKWNAVITDNDIVRFNAPFDSGSSIIPKNFKLVLEKFFPRYIKVLSQKKFKDEIDEIRVEGHTSYGWGYETNKDNIYLNNMQLSQQRANNVLSFCYTVNNKIIKTNKSWLEKLLRANGMAFSRPIFIKNSKKEDKNKSRRVEFRVLAKEHKKD